MGTIEVIQNEDCASTCQEIAILKHQLAEQRNLVDYWKADCADAKNKLAEQQKVKGDGE